jgi:hypothetical protein
MFINRRSGLVINVGQSVVNRFKDPDLPRGVWDKPGMSVTYYDFTLNPKKHAWMF